MLWKVPGHQFTSNTKAIHFWYQATCPCFDNLTIQAWLALFLTSYHKYCKRPRGRPETTWIKSVLDDLKSHELTLSLTEIVNVAQNSPLWRLLATTSTALYSWCKTETNEWVNGKLTTINIIILQQILEHQQQPSNCRITWQLHITTYTTDTLTVQHIMFCFDNYTPSKFTWRLHRHDTTHKHAGRTNNTLYMCISNSIPVDKQLPTAWH